MQAKINNEPKAQQPKNQPLHKIRSGGVIATIWKNERQIDVAPNKKVVVTDYSVSIERRYRDNDGNWHSTNSFNVTQLFHVGYVVQKAIDYIQTLKQQSGTEEVSEEVI